MIEVPVLIQGGQLSGPAYNVWHFEGAPADAAGVAPVLTALLAFYSSQSSSFASGSSFLVAPNGIKVVDITPNLIVGVTGGSTNGTGSSTLPGNVAAVLALRTALAGRRYLGRKFVGPLATASNNGGLFNESTRTGFLGAANTLRTAASAATWPLVVWSRLGRVATEVTGFTMDNHLDNLNSRKLR